MSRNRKIQTLKQAVILCGGYGKRLGPITKKIPKPLLKINNQPFLKYLLEYLIRYNFKKVLILSYYKKKNFLKFKQEIDNNIKKKLNIELIFEKEKLDTGGAIKNCYDKLDRSFLVINGDTYFNINLNNLILNSNINDSSILISSSQTNNKNSTEIVYNKQTKNIISLTKKEHVKASNTHSGFTILKKMHLNLIKKKNLI